MEEFPFMKHNIKIFKEVIINECGDEIKFYINILKRLTSFNILETKYINYRDKVLQVIPTSDDVENDDEMIEERLDICINCGLQINLSNEIYRLKIIELNESLSLDEPVPSLNAHKNYHIAILQHLMIASIIKHALKNIDTYTSTMSILLNIPSTTMKHWVNFWMN